MTGNYFGKQKASETESIIIVIMSGCHSVHTKNTVKDSLPHSLPPFRKLGHSIEPQDSNLEASLFHILFFERMPSVFTKTNACDATTRSFRACQRSSFSQYVCNGAPSYCPKLNAAHLHIIPWCFSIAYESFRL